MISKVFFSALVIFVIAQVTFADPALCPDPEDANELVYTELVSEPAPDFGRIERQFIIPRPANPVTCITWSGYVTGSIAAIGFSEENIKIRVVSAIRRGFYADLDVYAKNAA